MLPEVCLGLYMLCSPPDAPHTILRYERLGQTIVDESDHSIRMCQVTSQRGWTVHNELRSRNAPEKAQTLQRQWEVELTSAGTGVSFSDKISSTWQGLDMYAAAKQISVRTRCVYMLSTKQRPVHAVYLQAKHFVLTVLQKVLGDTGDFASTAHGTLCQEL